MYREIVGDGGGRGVRDIPGEWGARRPSVFLRDAVGRNLGRTSKENNERKSETRVCANCMEDDAVGEPGSAGAIKINIDICSRLIVTTYLQKPGGRYHWR